MERKGTEKRAVVRSQIQKGKKKKMIGAPAPQKGTTNFLKVDVKRPPASPCFSDEIDEDYAEFLKTYDPHESYSSGSDEIDADYAEFLKTYDPQEVYPYTVSSSGEAESALTVNTQERAVPPVQAKDGKR
jgi:hypothetical protein